VTSQLPKRPVGPLVVSPVSGGKYRPNLRSGRVMLETGIYFNAQEYLNLTNFRNMPKMKVVFEPSFQQRFLKAPAQYTEDIQEGDDRLVVTRKLVLQTIDPCAPGLEQHGISVCFKPGNKPVTAESKQHLDQIRQRLATALRTNPNDPEVLKYKHYQQMSDYQLLDQILNKQSTTKTITIQSVVPYAAYEFGKVPQMDLLNFNVPVVKVNQQMLQNRPATAILPSEIEVAGINPPRNAQGGLIPDAMRPPRIAGITPSQGLQGSTIVIEGTNLDLVTSAALRSAKDGTLFPQTIIEQKSNLLLMTNRGPGESHKIQLGWKGGAVESDQQYVVQYTPEKSPVIPAGPKTFDNSKDIDVTFLTGFTKGKSVTKIYQVEFADETWLTDRYYARFRYTASAGFGIRWPFQITGNATVDKVYDDGNPPRIVNYPSNTLCKGDFYPSVQNAKYCAQGAQVSLLATPFDGDAAFYNNIGVPQDKVFKGKEFVFELGVTCNLYASIPGPNVNVNCPDFLKIFDFGRDHLKAQLGSQKEQLANYTMSGRPLGLSLEVGPLGNLPLGTGYATLNPGVTIYGQNGNLSFDVKGLNANTSTNKIELRKQAGSFRVEENNAKGPWGVEISNPRYNVDILLAPSIQLEIGIGLGPFGWNKTFDPMTIDALAIDIGTYPFDRHPGTRRAYQLKNIGTRYHQPEPLAPPR